MPTIRDMREVEMEQTRLQIIDEFDNCFVPILKRYELFIKDGLGDYCLKLFNKRRNNPDKPNDKPNKTIRAYFVRKVFEYISNGKPRVELNFLIQKIGLIAEIIIDIQYLHNQILDAKHGVNNKPSIVQNLLAANILREILFDFINKELTPKYRRMVADIVGQILIYVDLGQRIEQQYNHYDSYKKDLVIDYGRSEIAKSTKLLIIQDIINDIKKETLPKKQFVEIYFKRIYLTNCSLFVLLTNLICQITKCVGKTKKEIRNYSLCYSMILQIVNDISDFVPTDLADNEVGKKNTDAMSDLRNFNITLPLIFYLCKNDIPRLIKKYLDGIDNISLDNFQKEIAKDIIYNGAIHNAKKVTSSLSQKAVACINPHNVATEFLKNMAEIGIVNKNFKALDKLK
jgi:geranylgeranyl pyrophosphate synthase